ncbi:cold shock domain-containing protein [Azospirillum sp. RWY-5-1]|uniref:Cold shock domain-containing protein n=1 Tax=Azospirillum oleiclasticum TaxID=2735135 RepID=A0ABX2TG93_9PROT|nr:cold shock domain-containing protein [Azospirillum oleiclasticum]NYZ16729.1 cold shock domain-containing protein [Azospirillum oleiclasticum]NYZ23369.1 cold shock domain-containing protein [Azospirillum oleiclasticum]
MYDRPQRGGHRAPEITHRNVRATVKWFNPTKGFGFVTPEDGSPDAFLHATVVQFSGHDALADGTTIVCDLSRGPKGPQVANIHSVDTSTASASPRSGGDRMGGDRMGGGGYGGGGGGGGRGGYRDYGAPSDSETVDGTVKWFNVTKGFGFIAPADGGKDIFVHKSALDRSGLDGIADGEQVRVTVRQGAKGPEAVRVELA